MKRPRIIRRVVKTDAKGRAKIARDRKARITMERITARDSRCCAGTCNGMITPKTEYAKVTRPTDYKNLGRRRLVPDPKCFHFECVPPEAKPLVRFLR